MTNPKKIFFRNIASILLLSLLFSTSKITAQYDQYGGNTEINETATGYFRLAKRGDMHFFVTPDGNGFRSMGVNHMHTQSGNNYDAIIENIKSWGFNSGDYQGPSWIWDKYPYTKGINVLETVSHFNPTKFKYRDVFSSSYLTWLDNQVKNIVEPQKNNKMLICYFLTDIPVWKRMKEGGWISFFKNLPSSSPGKQKWDTWKSNNSNKPEQDFLGVIAKQVYQKAHQYIKQYDSNHLIFSDKYLQGDMPESVVNEVLPYVDGIAVQPSNEWSSEFYNNITDSYGKPVFIADHVSSFKTDRYPSSLGQVVDTMEEYEEYYNEFINTALSNDFIVGINHCTYKNEPKSATYVKQGLLKDDGTPYTSTTRGIKSTNIAIMNQVYESLGATPQPETFPNIESATSGSQTDNPPSGIIDGSTAEDDRWSIDEPNLESNPKQVTIDYGSAKSFIGAKLWTYQNRAYQYRLEVSDNADTGFVTVIDATENTLSEDPFEHSFNTVMGRYVRFTVTGLVNSNSRWVSIRELEMLEGSAPPPAETFPNIESATSGSQSDNPPSGVIDGSTAIDDRWSINGLNQEPKEVIIDYGSEMSFNGSKLWTYLDRSYQYRLQVSNNPNNGFITIVDRTDNTSTEGPFVDSFPVAQGRYVRLIITGLVNSTSNWASIIELEMLVGSTPQEPTEDSVIGTFYIKNRNSGKRMTIDKAGIGEYLVLGSSSGEGNDYEFEISEVTDDDEMHLIEVNGLAIRNNDCSSTTGTIVETHNGNGNCARWEVIKNGDFYYLKNKQSMLFAKNNNCNSEEGTEITLTNDMDECAEWILEPVIASQALRIDVDSKQKTVFNIYPNPSSERLYISSEDNNESFNYTLSNMSGQVMYHGKTNGNTLEIDVSSLNKGLYILTYEKGDYTLKKKIIIN